MSESDALAMPMTVMSSVIFTFTSVPSRVLMLMVLPSTLSMVPRMRVGVGDCCAQALDASTDTTASRAASERGSQEVIFGMVYPSEVYVELRVSRRYPAGVGLFRLKRGVMFPIISYAW